MPPPSPSREALFTPGSAFQLQLKSHAELCGVAAQWQLEAKPLGRGRYNGLLQACHTSRMQLSFARHGLGSRFEGHIPKGTLVLCLTYPTSVPINVRGRPVVDREIFFQRCRAGIDFSFRGEIRILTVAVCEETVERHAAVLWQCDPQPHLRDRVMFGGGDGPDRARASLMEDLVTGVACPETLRDPVAGRRFERRVLGAMLAGLREPRPVEFAPARRRLARLAAEILHERCREDLSIEDLCLAVRASRRTLHLGFLEVYGMGPMAYLKCLRLQGVRRDLRSARPGDRNITHVAMSWGFTHLGRFAATYRAQFGRLPSEET